MAFNGNKSTQSHPGLFPDDEQILQIKPVEDVLMMPPEELKFYIQQLQARELTLTLQNRELFREIENRENQKRFHSLFNKVPAMMHTIDKKGFLLNVNDYWLDHTGYQKEEVVGRRLCEFLTKSSRDYTKNEVFPHFFKSGIVRNITCQMVKKNGVIMDILLSAVAEYDLDGSVVRSLSVLFDVTGQKKAEQALATSNSKLQKIREALEDQVLERTNELRQLNEHLLYTEERARSRLADDLHDSVTQTLALSISRLKDLRHSGSAHSEERLVELQDYLEQAINSIRSLTFQISPPILKDIDLDVVLAWLTEDLKMTHGMPIQFINRVDSALNLNEALKESVYRIIRELLMNIIKHSEAWEAWVTLSNPDGSLAINVEDNGKGFDTETIHEKKRWGYGLPRVFQRVSTLGGTIDINSKPGRGARICIEIPLINPDEEL